MSDILASCEAWQAYTTRLADAQRRQADILEQSAAATEAYATALREHDLEVQRVVLEGGCVPSDVPRPSESHSAAAQLIAAEVFRLRDEATAVLAGCADQVESKAAAAAQTRASKVRRAAETLEAARVEQNAESASLGRVRRARDLHAGVVVRPSEADRTRSDLDLAEYAQLVLDGRDPLQPVPVSELGLQTTARPRVELDSSPVTVQQQPGTLGLQVFTSPQGGDGGEEARRLARLRPGREWL